ncbi:MAG: hypothetical protein IT453_18640 [Planctomycetes bacterium]|nr:hypothetical protein [Planctomycetota bacterium]
MHRSLPKLALIAVFLLPTLLLAWLGFAALRSETERGTARYRERAEATLTQTLQRLDRELAAVARGDGDALAVRFGGDGTWLGPTLARLPAANANAALPADPLLVRSLEAEIDRLEVAGELELALDRLRIASEGDRPLELVAWALETRALLAVKLGRADDATAARRELVERCPDARTPSGLRRSFVARRELARSAPNGTSDLADVYADASADHASLDDTATADFVRSVRVELAERLAREPDEMLARRVAISDRDVAQRARLRRWLATIPRGASDWVASGAVGGSRVFELADEPIASANPLAPTTTGERVLVAVTRDGEGWRGGALELSRLFARTEPGSTPATSRSDERAGVEPGSESSVSAAATSRSDEVAGVEPGSVFSATIEPLLRATREAPIARSRLAAPLDAFEARVGGGDFASFLAGERRKLYWTTALVATVLVLALVAAFATLRAVAREVEAAKGREAFVAAVTHELKAPLAAIRLFAEVFERGDVEPEKVREFGARTVRETDRLARLVDSVLDLARLEHASGGPKREALELGELAARALATVEPLARERGFALELRREADVRVAGDRDALTGAIVNLLDNALKYSDTPHAIEVEVARATRDGAARAEVRVLDRGRGVPAGEAQRIFEPFRRVGDELTRDRPGVGLGLALVKKIAQAHGGEARCEPREGGGSVFTLSLAASEQHA